MPYIYRVSRREPSAEVATVTTFTTPVPNPQPEPEAPSYRDLQAQAKDLGIPTRQKAGKLKKAIAEATRNG